MLQPDVEDKLYSRSQASVLLASDISSYQNSGDPDQQAYEIN